MTEIVIYLAVGRVVIFALQSFPFEDLFYVGKFFKSGKFLYKLRDCDFCLGFWVYSFLALCFQINYLSEYMTIPILPFLLTGLISSFVMHLLRVGWETKFKIVIIE